jgi:hypothetical protein
MSAYDSAATAIIITGSVSGFITAIVYAYQTSKVELVDRRGRGGGTVDLELEFTERG